MTTTTSKTSAKQSMKDVKHYSQMNALRRTDIDQTDVKSLSTMPYVVLDNLKKHASNGKKLPTTGKETVKQIWAFFSKKYNVFESKQVSLHQAGVLQAVLVVVVVVVVVVEAVVGKAKTAATRSAS